MCSFVYRSLYAIRILHCVINVCVFVCVCACVCVRVCVCVSACTGEVVVLDVFVCVPTRGEPEMLCIGQEWWRISSTV